jgi:hypothetical protein
MRLVAFELNNGGLVFVNPNQVRCITPIASGSKIEFGRDHYLPVTVGPDEVQRKLLSDKPR